MTKETIKQIILKADEGMYITNGQTFGKTVVLPENADQSAWYEITEAEYNEIIAKRDEQQENQEVEV